MSPIRILIVDDSSLARSLLRHLLEEDPAMEVVGEAVNGREAVAMALQLKPHLMTLDLEMPVMDGLATIQVMMAECALPILVVSSVADAHKAYQAVQLGALDVISKPEYDSPASKIFVDKVRMLAKVRVITHLRSSAKPLPAPVYATAKTAHVDRIIAIASSTGGPRALAQILPRLPANFPTPIVIAQHISEGFAPGMALWLASLCPLPVKMAGAGMQLEAATIYLAPSEYHLEVTHDHRLLLQQQGALDLYHPSCDRLLRSVAVAFKDRALGIILTGMGSDGVQGLAQILAGGGRTLGQDECSSVVYGMNRVAIEQGLVQRVLSVDSIADEMLRWV